MSLSEVKFKSGGPHRISATINVDEVGVCSITEVLLCEDESMAAAALDFSAGDCPLGLQRPFVTGSSADRIEGGMFQVTRNFSAVIEEDTIGEYKLYRTTSVAGDEPIQAHPKFTELAGTFANPNKANGAYWRPGEFVGFTPYVTTAVPGGEPKLTKNRKAGITHYRMPIIKFSETKLVLSEDLSNEVRLLGKVSTPPDHPLCPKYKTRNYLLTKADPEWVAEGVFKLVREWSMSGPKGWNDKIYPQ